MAEQEVIKHTKQVYKIWTSKSHSFWHKLKEFFIEIVIIVFAVTLSIWLHDRSEHKHQQKEVKEFLLGLRQDLLSDIKEMKDDRQSYLRQKKIFSYIISAGVHGALNPDTLRNNQQWLLNTTRLNQNNGRFEGFKASGKIGNIPAIMICVTIWSGLCYMGYSTPTGNANYFYVLASLVGFVMGGTQALSRSTYSKLMPVTRDTASFFSFFDVSEKIGIVIGLFLFGFLTEVTGSQRISVLFCMVFFIVGLLLLFITRKRLSNETVLS